MNYRYLGFFPPRKKPHAYFRHGLWHVIDARSLAGASGETVSIAYSRFADSIGVGRAIEIADEIESIVGSFPKFGSAVQLQ